ncbi:MAG: acetyl-CoA carboxylase biotin carboxyl carrier protein subunit, partial [Bacteroidales bacterium]|nr:acetyl-CoA carboxylase biotin carboxyl carrier protein subunit [Bacteroidales bacterium]
MQVKIEEQVYEVEVEDLNARPVIALVDGERIEVWPEDDTSEVPVTASVVPAQSRAAGPVPLVKPAATS